MMRRMKSFLYRALLFCGVVALVRFFHRNSLTILLYHGVAPQEERPDIYNYRGKFITPEAFEFQLNYFARHYTIIELDEAYDRMRAGTLPKNPLVITFDDGYRNFYEYAFPILKRHKLPATIFLATDFVLRKKPLWVDRLEYAIGGGIGSRETRSTLDDRIRNEFKQLSNETREARLTSIEAAATRTLIDFEDDRAIYAPLSVYEIREMQTYRIHVGAHTRTHPILSRETPEDAQSEIAGSLAELSAIVPLSRVFAYPNGQADDATPACERMIEDAGCVAALTTLAGVNGAFTPPYRLHRFAMDATDASPAFASVASGVRLYLSKIKQLIYA